MNKINVLILLFFVITGLPLKATDKILCKVAEQDLQLGMSINEAVNGILKLFCKKEVVLFDSPQKKRKLTLEEICDIKNNTPYYTNQLSKVFVYSEIIENKNKSYKFRAYGISVVLVNQQNSIGFYLDLYDINSKSIAKIESKGKECQFVRMGLESILNSTDYNFDIIYFNKTEIKDFNKSEQLKNKYIKIENDKIRKKEVVFSTQDMFERAANPSANIDDSLNVLLSIPENAKKLFPLNYKPIRTNVFHSIIYAEVNYSKDNKILDTQFISFEVQLPDTRRSNKCRFDQIPAGKMDLISIIKVNKKGLRLASINNRQYGLKENEPKLYELPCGVTKK